MFTGLVRGFGEVVDVQGVHEKRMRFATKALSVVPDEGASIACNGCCLTALNITKHGDEVLFSADLSPETLEKTTAHEWSNGTRINIEPSLRLGEEMGGHIVSGHVDGLGTVVSVEPLGDNHVVVFQVADALKPFIASKGSIAIDGVSLTVNNVDHHTFSVNVIPHTWEVTNLNKCAPGVRVNVEIDMLARYVSRMMEVLGKQ